MAQSAIHLTQSRFYSPVFNAAVFDGPIRIYFAQNQEAQALQIYLRLQQYLKDTYSTIRKSFKLHGQTVFLMLYPNMESFDCSFADTSCSPTEHVASERLGEDYVLGVRGLLEESQYNEVFAKVESILQAPNWNLEVPAPETSSP
jgi:hypothetical protein